MLEWLYAAVPFIKAIHIGALCLWCGGLLALPMMLARHEQGVSSEDYRLIVRATHHTYTLCVTPAAVIAVIAGTWLIFLREVFVPWLYAKLAFVALLVLVHAWVGHMVALVAEAPAEHKPPRPLFPTLAAGAPMIAILVLVLAKPALEWIALPGWLLEPRGGQLLFEIPRR